MPRPAFQTCQAVQRGDTAELSRLMPELRHAARLGEDTFGRAALQRWGLRWIMERWSGALWGLSN